MVRNGPESPQIARKPGHRPIVAARALSEFFPIDTKKHYTYDQIHPIYHNKYDGWE
ncbi:hypothetical protein PCA31118_01279 [Pandoraea captiosa]|uniref:Uncharacterized protein n=1 Tax=Pandoraea captiosa TaxID=2508302 RepID=A0A5E4ZT89_9BURK|nr:hypothetical protein PCA31118_01279 [Pandoraea captiosa]